MTVVKIEALSGSRSRVLLENEESFVLYKGELRKYRIEEGGQLSEAAYRELQTQVLPKRAKLRAMNLLKNRRYTEKEMMDKLLGGGYQPKIAREAVDYVKSYHYIDDRQYTMDYITCRAKGHSLREMEQKLLRKGIDRELFGEVLQELEAEGFDSEEEAAIRHILIKKHCTEKVMDDREKQRIYAWFYRKGFSLDTVRAVMEDVLLDIT